MCHCPCIDGDTQTSSSWTPQKANCSHAKQQRLGWGELQEKYRWRPGAQGHNIKREALITWEVAWKVTERQSLPCPSGSWKPPCPSPRARHRGTSSTCSRLAPGCLPQPIPSIPDFMLSVLRLIGHPLMLQLCSTAISFCIWDWFLQTIILVHHLLASFGSPLCFFLPQERNTTGPPQPPP